MIDLAYIIPAFNAADTIGDTLRSVLTQRGPRIHAIVVDDGSTDATGDIARSHRDWRLEVVRQSNRGLAGARNTGFEILEDRAGAVCFLDADDTVEQGHAAALVDRLERRSVLRTLSVSASGAGSTRVAGNASMENDATRTPGAANGADTADIVACAYRMLGPRLNDLDWTIDAADHDFDPARLIEFNPFAVGAVAVRVEMLRRIAGDRPFDESLPVHEDWALWLRLAAAGVAWGGVVHERLFNYRLRPGSLSLGVERMWREGRRVIDCAPVTRPPAGCASAPNKPTAAPDATVVVDGDHLPDPRASARRRWTLRHLARAAVAAPHLVAELLSELDAQGGRAMDAADRAAFLGSLRHAFLLEHAIGPGQATEHEAAWQERAKGALAAWPECFEAVDSLAFTSWEGVASRLARLLGRVGGRGRLAHLRPVIAGMGRNGRALAGALAARSIAFDWLDDDGAAQCPVRATRLGPSDVAPRHLVIVTPTAPDALLESLRRTRALVMTPAELVASGHETTPEQQAPRRVA